MTAKRDYQIDDLVFHVERREKTWVGWFVDTPESVLYEPLKMDLLRRAGYKPSTSGVRVEFRIEGGEYISATQYRNARTMEDAYREFKTKLDSGHFPRFNLDRPLSKFVIMARDRCVCVYCGEIPENSVDLHLDHIVPHSVGGACAAENVVVACSSCNLSKGDRRRANEVELIEEVRRRNHDCEIPNDHPVETQYLRTPNGNDSPEKLMIASQRETILRSFSASFCSNRSIGLADLPPRTHAEIHRVGYTLRERVFLECLIDHDARNRDACDRTS